MADDAAVLGPMSMLQGRGESVDGEGQPKAAMHYRQGGDHCGVCMFFNGAGDGKGTCPRVVPPDVDAGDLCDDFGRAAREKPDREVAGNAMSRDVAGVADNLQRRGMISDKAMAGLRGRDY
jgi:hypothetical protein